MNDLHLFLLFVDSDALWLQFCRESLVHYGEPVILVSSITQARETLISVSSDIGAICAIFDISVTKRMDEFLELIDFLKNNWPSYTVVVYTLSPDPNQLMNIYRSGVSNCTSKPYSKSELTILTEQSMPELHIVQDFDQRLRSNSD